MQKLLMVGWVACFLLALLTYPVVGILAGGAVEAYIIAAKDPSVISVDEEIFEAPKGVAKDSKAYRDAVMRVYGSQTDEPTKVVFVSKEKFLQPKLLPGLMLLPVDKQKGENPLQLKTVYFFAPKIMLGFSVAGFICTIAWIVMRRKSMPSPPAAPAAPAA